MVVTNNGEFPNKRETGGGGPLREPPGKTKGGIAVKLVVLLQALQAAEKPPLFQAYNAPKPNYAILNFNNVHPLLQNATAVRTS